MSIIVECDCGKKYKLGDDKAGKKMRCKECNGVVAIPKPKTEPADEWDDFGDGGLDDFGGSDDDYGQAEAAPRPKSKSGSKSKRKGSGKSKGKGKKKKSAKSGGGMAPALKYSIAGGIVVVTAGIVVGILYSRGMIGGGEKKDDGDEVAAKGDDTPPGGEIPGGGNPGGANPGDKQPPGGKAKSVVSNTKTGGGKVSPPDTKKRPAGTPIVFASGTMLKLYKSGDRSQLKRRILVKGKVAKPLEKGWIIFEGDGTRAVACHFVTPPKSPPTVGQTVTIEGEFTLNNDKFITLIKSRLVADASQTASGKTQPKSDSKFPIRLSNPKVAGSGRVWTASIDYEFVRGKPDPESIYNFMATVPPGIILLKRVKGSQLKVRGTIDISGVAFAANPKPGDVKFELATGLGRSKRAADTVTVAWRGVAPKVFKSYAAAELVKTIRPGDKTLKGKSIRVQGEALLNGQNGVITLVGDKQRAIVCQFKNKQQRLAFGQKVLVEGTFVSSRTKQIELLDCRLIKDTKNDGSKTGGSKLDKKSKVYAAAELVKQISVGDKTLDDETIRVAGTVQKPLAGGWIVLMGNGKRTVACHFNAAPGKTPEKGATVIIEGTFATSIRPYVSMKDCRIVERPKK